MRDGKGVLTMRSCKKAWRASTDDAVPLRAMAPFSLRLGCARGVCGGIVLSRGRREKRRKRALQMALYAPRAALDCAGLRQDLEDSVALSVVDV